MIAAMTLDEIQKKYAGVHTPEEVAQYQQNMTNNDKWKVKKNVGGAHARAAPWPCPAV